jgi:phospholipase C
MQNQNSPSLIIRKTRRRFLQQFGAGLAALAAPLQAQRPKARFQKRGASIPQINHIICLCQENHSFDHYFGTYTGLPSGYGIPANYTSSGHAPFHFTTLTDNNTDPNHDWNAIHTGYANGAMNGWYAAGGIDTLGYYESSDLAYYYSLFPEYTLCANYCSGMLSETQPNRMIYYSGTSGGNCCDCIETNGTLDSSTYPCILDLLQMYGISFANYNFGVPANYCYLALWSNWQNGGPNNELNQTQDQFFTDCTNNTLPQVVFITNESPNDEHPPEDIQTGEAQMQQIIEAVQASPAWASSAILLTWDEGGGFFDHIAPQQLDAYGPGVRIPMIVISPFAKKGYVDTVFQDHGSFLKFIEAVYGLPTLASINHTFDTSTPLTNNSTNGAPFPPRDGNSATGNLTQCFTFTTSPSFSLSANPTSVTVQQGASGTSTITPAISGGFNSAIALSASGMPSGVTASFNPSTIPAPGSGSSTLTLTVSTSAAVGTYSITITGTGGGLTQTTTVSLTVSSNATPSFTLTPSPSSVTVQQGASGTSSITAAVSGGFNNAIALSASGLPSGVTAGFNPSSIAAPGSGSSTLTLTVGSSAAVGTYSITVTGTGGGVTQTTTVSLTVSSSGTPSFTLTANPGSVTVAQGSSGTSTITASVSGGYNNSIALSASGMPSGVTAGFNPSTIPAPGSGSSTLTLTVASSAATGTYTINVIGTGFGGISQNTSVSLTVSAPSTNLIQNGGFETGSFTDWTAAGPVKPTVTKAEAHSGSYSALLGQTSTPEVDGNSSIYQTIKIPGTASKVTLTFWYWPGTNDTIEYAYQEALILNTSGQTLATPLKVASNIKTWTQVTYDLTSYKGETIRVYFAVHGNGYGPDYIYMYVDDVSVTVQ